MWHHVIVWVVPSISKDYSAFLFIGQAVQEEWSAGPWNPQDEGTTILHNSGYYSPTDTVYKQSQKTCFFNMAARTSNLSLLQQLMQTKKTHTSIMTAHVLGGWLVHTWNTVDSFLNLSKLTRLYSSSSVTNTSGLPAWHNTNITVPSASHWIYPLLYSGNKINWYCSFLGRKN